MQHGTKREQRNQQEPMKRCNGDGKILAVNSVFLTVQGEGPATGRPAVFVRLQGCNLQCPDCDTDYTPGSFMTTQDILMTIAVERRWARTNLVVITGGEPFRQKLKPLVDELLHYRYEVHVETNGTLYEEGFPYERVTVVCSPKAPRIPPKLMTHIDYLKYIIDNAYPLGADGLPNTVLGRKGIARPAKLFPRDKVYLHPAEAGEDAEHFAKNMRLCVLSSIEHGYTVGLQIHKILGVE